MITYLVGDATAPGVPGQKVISHICNNRGAWGAGFVLAVSRRWPEPERIYRRPDGSRRLGSVQFVRVTPEITVCNMIAQELGWDAGPPIRYDALRECLGGLVMMAEATHLGEFSVHMPRIGCGLAGGTWDRVEPIISSALPDIPVFVYDLPEKRK